MLRALAGRAGEEGLRLAPFVGVGCPGMILPEGAIERGGQNLPGGGWEGESLNLPRRFAEMLPEIPGGRPAAAMHNDAAMQGVSDILSMQDFKRWGVLTTGTGLGNARVTNKGRESN